MTQAGERGAAGRGLSAFRIVVMVVAAVAPMGGIVGTVPLSFALGTGVGTPGTYAVVGAILFCFAVGYAAMGRHVVSAGGFYAYISQGLGRIPAVAGSFVAVLAYNALTIGLVGAFAYFSHLTLENLVTVDVPWQVFAGLAVLLLVVLGRRQIEVSARTLVVLLVAEFAIIAILDVAILIHERGAALPAASWAPHNVFGGSLGVSLMLAFTAYTGFESSSLYGAEARDPRRSIPRATFAAVLLITGLYVITSWLAVGAVGADQIQQRASADLGGFFFALNAEYVSVFTTKLMYVLLCTSLFASILALHNATSRYLAALGSERVLPSWLGRHHARSGAPANASALQSALCVVVVGGAALAGADPYLNLATTAIGLGTLGLIVLQALAAFSVIGYFLRRPADRRWVTTIIVPSIGAVGLVVASILASRNFAVLAGSTSTWVTSLPWLVLVAAALGGFWAVWLRRSRPEVYARLGGLDLDQASASPDTIKVLADDVHG